MSIGVVYLNTTKQTLEKRLEGFKYDLEEYEKQAEILKTQIRTCSSDIDGINFGIAKLKGETL
jgi:chaperonin cofactor prefoldin